MSVLNWTQPDAAAALADQVRVELRHWPAEAEDVEDLRRRRVPRVLLVAPDEPAPISSACEEDWVRLPIDSADLDSRRATVARRVLQHSGRPRLDDHARLHVHGRWVRIDSRIGARLLEALLEQPDAVVETDRLMMAGWPGGSSTVNALRVQIARLNHQLRTVGLRIQGLRGTDGYVVVHDHRS